MPAAGTRATFSHLVNTDFVISTNINSTEACTFPPSGSLDKCASICANTSGCTAFVYAPNNPDSSGRSTKCVLKSAAAGRVVRASTVAAVLVPTGSIGYNVTCPGDSVWNSTRGACVSNCTCDTTPAPICTGQPASAPGVAQWNCAETQIGGTCQAPCSGAADGFRIFYSGTAEAECVQSAPGLAPAWAVTDCSEVYDDDGIFP